MSDKPVGRVVVAWRGERHGQRGVIVRTDGVYHCYVRWQDGEITHYENAALTRPEFIARNTG